MNTITGNPRIKWWRLKKDKFPKIKFRETVLGKVKPWECAGMVGAEEQNDFDSRKDVLSITTERRSRGDKETWWGNDKGQEVILKRQG